MACFSYEQIQFFEDFIEAVGNLNKAGQPGKADQLTSIWTALHWNCYSSNPYGQPNNCNHYSTNENLSNSPITGISTSPIKIVSIIVLRTARKRVNYENWLFPEKVQCFKTLRLSGLKQVNDNRCLSKHISNFLVHNFFRCEKQTKL